MPKRGEEEWKKRGRKNILSVLLLTISMAGATYSECSKKREMTQTAQFTATAGMVTPIVREISLIEENVWVTTQEIPLSKELQIATQEYCSQYDVPYPLVLAVIQTESSFDPTAVNKNCFGYMQIHSIHKANLLNEIGVTDFKEPHQNIHSGVYLLKNLYEKYENWSMALVAYNCGEAGAYKNYFKHNHFSSGYSKKVLSRQKEWSAVIGKTIGEEISEKEGKLHV